MNERRLIEANTRLVDEIRGLNYDIAMLESKMRMDKDMKELYERLKEAKETPALCYTLSSSELYILMEYLEKQNGDG